MAASGVFMRGQPESRPDQSNEPPHHQPALGKLARYSLRPWPPLSRPSSFAFSMARKRVSFRSTVLREPDDIFKVADGKRLFTRKPQDRDIPDARRVRIGKFQRKRVIEIREPLSIRRAHVNVASQATRIVRWDVAVRISDPRGGQTLHQIKPHSYTSRMRHCRGQNDTQELPLQYALEYSCRARPTK